MSRLLFGRSSTIPKLFQLERFQVNGHITYQENFIATAQSNQIYNPQF